MNPAAPPENLQPQEVFPLPVLTRKPAKAIHYPPSTPSPRAIHRYATGGKWTDGAPENWEKIANRYGVDVWDLILYNFQCRNPEEVNWCMQEFLHCSVSKDGKNFSFSPSDAHPVVFIPPPGFHFFIPADSEARNLVVGTLQSVELDMVNFESGGLSVNRSLFRDVLKHVNSNTILCSGNPGLAPPAVVGRWLGDVNIMFVRSPGVVTLSKKATIVHEAVHAGFDVRKKKSLLLEGEVCGYVAEAAFSILASGTPVHSFNPFDPTIRADNIRRWAGFLAKQSILHALSGSASPTFVIASANPALHKLRSLISADPAHKTEVFKPQFDDGV